MIADINADYNFCLQTQCGNDYNLRVENVDSLNTKLHVDGDTNYVTRFARYYGTNIPTRTKPAKLESLIRFVPSVTGKNYLLCKTS